MYGRPGLDEYIINGLNIFFSFFLFKRCYLCIYSKMRIFKLSGSTPLLTLKLETPIHLDDGVQYMLALTGLYCENYFYNTLGGAAITFNRADLQYPTDTFGKGHWSVDSIVTKINKFLKSRKVVENENDVDMFKIYRNGEKKLCVESPIDCHLNNEMRRLLGFNSVKHDDFKNKHVAENIVYVDGENKEIRPFNVIEVHCNLIENSFVNHPVHSHKHLDTSILYQLDPRKYKEKISEKPNVLDYVPLRNGVRVIKEIQINLMDENNIFLQNAGQYYIVYLKLVRQ